MMEQTAASEQARGVSKIANFWNVVVRIWRGFSIAGLIVSAVFTVLVLIFGEAMLVSGSERFVSFGSLKLELTEAATPDFTALRPTIFYELQANAITCGIFWFMANAVLRFLADARNGRPFTENAPKALERLGLGVIVYTVSDLILTAIHNLILKNAYNLNDFFRPDTVKEISVNTHFSLYPLLLVGLALYFLSRVFRYGIRLQQESDETL